jgi:hypothetical protein
VSFRLGVTGTLCSWRSLPWEFDRLHLGSIWEQFSLCLSKLVKGPLANFWWALSNFLSLVLKLLLSGSSPIPNSYAWISRPALLCIWSVPHPLSLNLSSHSPHSILKSCSYLFQGLSQAISFPPWSCAVCLIMGQAHELSLTHFQCEVIDACLQCGSWPWLHIGITWEALKALISESHPQRFCFNYSEILPGHWDVLKPLKVIQYAANVENLWSTNPVNLHAWTGF